MIDKAVLQEKNAGASKEKHNVRAWGDAFKQVWPVYLASRIVFLILTYLSSLFLVGNFSPQVVSLSSLLSSWGHWDAGHFIAIATKGYAGAWQTAFFPLYPVLIKALVFLIRDPLISSLVIANLASLVLMVVFFRLVNEDFGQDLATRTILYLAVFPTAFFLAAPYNESLFLCLALVSFYNMRRGNWWWAGLYGLLAALTRSSGIFLLVPFSYEYLRQHDFNLKKLRLDSISCVLIPIGICIFAAYCFFKFHDLLAFSHAQSVWNRKLAIPGWGFIASLKVIVHGLHHNQVLTFNSIHNMIDLTTGLIFLGIVILFFAGPWRFSKEHWSYALYGAAIYLFLILFPSTDAFPLQSLSRLLLEVFPAFIILAMLGKRYQFNLYYLSISSAVLCFMLLQFLTGGWMV